jgi:hypothetical protein
MAGLASVWREHPDLLGRSPQLMFRTTLTEVVESTSFGGARETAGAGARWPQGHAYVNADTGRVYAPHTDEERRFVESDSPRYALAKGGEGAGKSVAGIVKVLQRLRRGMSGIMVSPDLEHFKKSLWPEFRRWCPWGAVVESQRYRSRAEWEPSKPFTLVFKAEHGGRATLYCGGIEEPGSWEGPNVSFAHMDEARRKKDGGALKVLDGRLRIAGPRGEPPQLLLTTTPRKNWLYDYFGPPPTNRPDPFADFKRDALVVTLRTTDNAANLADGYLDQRKQSLTSAEIRVLVEAEWEDLDDAARFLPSMVWWDACLEPTPPLDNQTPLVLALDAAVSGDCFGLVGVSRHWERHEDVAVRYVRKWEPHGKKLDYGPIEDEVRQLCETFNVVCVTYDPYQLHSTATRLEQEGVGWFDPFNQGAARLVADKQLLDLISHRRLAHDGNADLREHLDNADRKSDGQDKLRLVKRTEGQKIDLVVTLSMAAARCLELNL